MKLLTWEFKFFEDASKNLGFGMVSRENFLICIKCKTKNLQKFVENTAIFLFLPIFVATDASQK